MKPVNVKNFSFFFHQLDDPSVIGTGDIICPTMGYLIWSVHMNF